MKSFVGIDPGFSGAVAFINVIDEKLPEIVTFVDMPLVCDAKGRNLIDARALFNLLRNSARYAIAIEQVGAMPQQGVTSMFRMGQGFGTVSACAMLTESPVHFVLPMKWKKMFNVLGEKDFARVKAIEQFPNLYDSLKRKKDNGRADAFWIAKYAQSLAKKGDA